MIFHRDKLSAIIIKARARKGLSQTYMAHNLGVSQKTYSYFESGKGIPGFIDLLQIAHDTETHPMLFIDHITVGVPSWGSTETTESKLQCEIAKLEANISFLKSQNEFLKMTICKLLDKQQ
jgi:transcriptional regulator with XRE-family HTH domain